ncbi:MAG TPA: hypothetical protein VKV32_16395 [Stellaceae bacterium]|nr:hypothetical protein [Stellaceae bacterium]
MRWIFQLLGHGAGLTGVLIGIGSILRAATPGGMLRFIPYLHGVTSLAIGGPLSIALLAIAALFLGSGDGAG